MSVLDNSFDYSREVSSRAAWLDNASSNLLSDNSIYNSTMRRNEPAWLGAVDFYDSSAANARTAEGEPTPEGEPVAEGATEEAPSAPEGETPAPTEGETPTEGEAPAPEAETPAPTEGEGPAPPVPVGPPDGVPSENPPPTDRPRNAADPKGTPENVPVNPNPPSLPPPGERPRAVEGPPPPGAEKPEGLPGTPEDAEGQPHTNDPFENPGSVADIKRKAMEKVLGEGNQTPGRPSPISDDAIPKTFGEHKREQMDRRPEFEPTDWEREMAERLVEIVRRRGLQGGNPVPGGGLGGGKPGVAAAVPKDPNAPPPSGEPVEKAKSRNGG